ncbi:TolB family protein [Frateuria sp. GZRR35]|uniref:TolB family protein n=1 Tax=unclassified Frateuria TaxID=2648894 RepID=UPI003EDBF418
MKRRAILSLLAVIAAVSVAPAGVAQTTSTASILFSRTYAAGDGSAYSSVFRVKPSGENAVPLTSAEVGINYQGATWSPGGSAVVFEHLRADRPDRSQLFVVNRQGASLRRVTSGAYKHQQPSWGPGIIGYISDRGHHDLCFSVVHADGTGQRDVFCPQIENRPSEPMTLSILRWTADGTSVVLEAGAYTDNLEGVWWSHLYRVNVASGAAVKISQMMIGDTSVLALSPDETHGIYAYSYVGRDPGWKMRLADFSAGTLTEVIQGQWPQYSRDGSKIAFDRLQRIYVMNADGTDIHEVISAPDPDAVYSLADWSWDGTRLLINKTSGDQTTMQIVDLATGAMADVAEGTAAEHGWYHF